MICTKCGNEIPKERLEILPSTTVCVDCTTEEKKVGIMVYDHKTAPRLEIFDPSETEMIRQAERFVSRSRK